jgi:hypothetical protein
MLVERMKPSVVEAQKAETIAKLGYLPNDWFPWPTTAIEDYEFVEIEHE